jgi:DNA-directed RNA polymerase subunit beta'
MEVKTVLDDSGDKVRMVTRSGNVILKIKDKKEEYEMAAGAMLKVNEGESVKSGHVLAEYDQTYDYVISSAPGKVLYVKLEILQRKKRGDKGTYTERIVRKDGEIFVYNPKAKKTYKLGRAKSFVRFGDKVQAGDDLADGVACKVTGMVIEATGSKVVVVPGESYLMIAGSSLMVEDGDEVDSYDVMARVESIRRDPSKTRDIIQGLPKVEELFEARRPKDPALLSEIEGLVSISEREGSRLLVIKGAKDEKKEYTVPYEVRMKVTVGDRAHKGTQLTEGTVNPHDVLKIMGVRAVQEHLVNEIQKIYRSQGVTINDKHIEVIVRQMTRRVRVLKPGDTTLLPGELVERSTLDKVNEKTKGEKATGEEVLLGITKASLTTESFISAASFQETARVLTEAAIKGKCDEMYGLKENVCIGRLIPAGTGFQGYRNLELIPATGEML